MSCAIIERYDNATAWLWLDLIPTYRHCCFSYCISKHLAVAYKYLELDLYPTIALLPARIIKSIIIVINPDNSIPYQQ